MNVSKCKAIQKKSGNKITTDMQKRINPEKECIDLEYCENTPILPINSKATNRAKRS
jgi:hypothetical protein